MRRRRWKRVIAWSAVGLVAAVAGSWLTLTLLLNNAGFRQYLLGIAQQRLSETLGAPLRVRDFTLHLAGLNPSVDLYDAVLEGSGPVTGPPLLQVAHLTVGIQITSVLHRRWDLSSVVMDHPVVRIVVDANGDTNLPKGSSNGQGQTSVFDLGARQVKMTSGELYYNDRKSLLDVDLHDVQFQSTFAAAEKKYSGTLSYHEGRIQFPDIHPVTHGLDAEFDATPNAFQLTKGTLTVGDSKINLTGNLQDYANPLVHAVYNGDVNSSDVAGILKDVVLPVGVLHLEGSGDYQNNPAGSFVDGLTLAGTLSSPSLQVHTPTIHTQIRDLNSTFTFAKGTLELPGIQAGLLGGNATGSFTMRDVAAAQESELHAVLSGVGLAGIQSLLQPASMKQVRVTGTTNIKLDATWRKALEALVARADATLKGTLAPTRQAQRIPVSGEFHAAYTKATEQLSLTRSSLHTLQTSITAEGTLGERSRMDVKVQANDLRDVEAMATAFGALAQPTGSSGNSFICRHGYGLDQQSANSRKCLRCLAEG